MKIFGTDYACLAGKQLSALQGIERIYFRADNALVNSGKTLYSSPWMKDLYFMPHLVVRVGRVGRGIDIKFADRYYSEVAFGFSLYDPAYMQSQQEAGLDAMLSYSFDGSLMVSSMVPKEEMNMSNLMLRVIEANDGVTIPTESIIIPSDEEIKADISLLSDYFLLKMGDLITIPLWQKYLPLKRGQHIHLASGEDEMLFMGIK